MSSEQNFREGLCVFIRSSAFTEKVNTIGSFYLSRVFYMMLTITYIFMVNLRTK